LPGWKREKAGAPKNRLQSKVVCIKKTKKNEKETERDRKELKKMQDLWEVPFQTMIQESASEK